MTPATLAECRSLAPMSSRELGRFARFDGDGWNFEQRTGQQKTESKTHAASPDPSLNFYVSTPKLVVNQTLYYKNSVSNRDTANTILGPVMSKSFYLTLVRLWKRRPWRSDIDSCMPSPCL